MSGMMMGAIAGGIIGVVSFIGLRMLAGRVELPETKTVLNTVGIVDLALFPVLGAFIGGLITGD
ncbi:MAG TPA: hypothetical protein VMF90_07805 [Rhizobiaceae bacterium]|nr:hypothetical protein [Rhizobiaceae bacterium]